MLKRHAITLGLGLALVTACGQTPSVPQESQDSATESNTLEGQATFTRCFPRRSILDYGFGTCGKVSDARGRHVNDMLVLPNGLFTVAGDQEDNFDYWAKYNSDGLIQNQHITGSVGVSAQAVRSSDEKIISYNANIFDPATSGVFGILLTEDEDLFGPGSGNLLEIQKTRYHSTDGLVTNLLPTSDNKLILAGHKLTRYDASTFAKEPNDFAEQIVDAVDAQRTPNGRVLTIGSRLNFEEGAGVWVRAFDANGHVDSSYGNGGKVAAALNNNLGFRQRMYSVPGNQSSALQADGKLVILTRISNGAHTLIRLNADGTKDSSFGIGGYSYIAPGGFTLNAIALQADGKIVAAGGKDKDFYVTRFNPNGSLDRAWGSNGSAEVGFFNGLRRSADEAKAVRVLPNGRILVAGESFRDLETDNGSNYHRISIAAFRP